MSDIVYNITKNGFRFGKYNTCDNCHIALGDARTIVFANPADNMLNFCCRQCYLDKVREFEQNN